MQPFRTLQPVGMLLGGTYRIERKLAEGGMGIVYEATHVRLPLRFAVKVLDRPAEDKESQIALERFKREAQVTATIVSPHVVQVFDYQIAEDGYPFIVMELLDGEDLSTRLRRDRKPFPPEEALNLLDQIAEGLDAAHALGIVHRDLKPANVFLNTKPKLDFVKVLDFGISKMKGDESITGEASIVGTPLYMSPEQATAQPQITKAADIFALGAIAYELLTGQRAFDADSMHAIIRNVVLAQPPEATRFLGPSVPAVDDVFARALAKHPDDRFGTAAELVGSLRTALRPLLPSRRLSSDQYTVPLVQLPVSLEALPTLPPTAALPEHGDVTAGASTPAPLAEPPLLSVAQIAACALIVILTATAATIAVRRSHSSVSAVTTPAPREVRLRVRAIPNDAIVELDGHRVFGELALPSRAAPRRLHVTRDGYETEDRDVPGTEAGELTVALEPIDVSALRPTPDVPIATPLPPDRAHHPLRPKPVKMPVTRPVEEKPPKAPAKRPLEAPVQTL